MKRDGLKVRQSVNHSLADPATSAQAISAPATSSAAQPAYSHNFADVGVYQPQSAAGMTVQRCACDGKKDEDDKKHIHRKASGDGQAQIENADIGRVLSSAGAPLEAGLHAKMAQGFGYDFSTVRVYNGSLAAQSAKALDARAYTVGSNVVFGEQQFAPDSSGGRELIAHELAHVVQQSTGLTAGVRGLDGGKSDPLEIAADRMAHQALHSRPSAPRASSAAAAPSSEAGLVQRDWEPTRPTAPAAGHTAGSDYQGPNGIVTRQGEKSASLFGSTMLGGATSYGCYCGPGGDANGSRCGENAPAIDAIDEQCRQHDQNYGTRGVTSVVTDPATQASMFSLDGLLKSEDADRRLADSTAEALETTDGLSSGTRLYSQGITGFFGARANAAHAYNWGNDRYNEASAGLSGAAGDASSWLGTRSDDLSSGLSGFAAEAGSWNTPGQAIAGAGRGAGRALGWMGDTAGSALGGVAGALGSGLDWGLNTGNEALGGVGSTASNAARWGMDTAGAVGNVVADQAAQLGSSAWDAVSNFSLRDAGIGQPLTSPGMGAAVSSGVSQLGDLGSSAMDAVRNFSLSDAGIGQPLTSPALMDRLRDWF